METSIQPAGRIPPRAYCSSEWDCRDFAILNCNGRKERIGTWLKAARPFGALQSLLPFRFYDNRVNYFVADEDGIEILPDGKDWTSVHPEDGEEESFKQPETFPGPSSPVLFPEATGIYRCTGKYTGEEFYTSEIPLGVILEQTENREIL